MTIEIKKENYYSGLWRAELAGLHGEGDVLACLFKDNLGDGCWHLIYRFRYVKDDKIFDSADQKNWYHMKSNDGAPERETEMEAVWGAIMEKGGEEGTLKNITWLPCKGDGLAMMKIMMNPERPWMHRQELTPEQYAEYAKTGKVPE